jgi:KDO2-lipid IV(A) lauroyltransferase
MAELPDPLELPAPPARHAGRSRVRRALRHAFRSVLARASLRISSWLPLSAGQRLGTLLAPVAIRFRGRVRDSILTNLQLCFPELGEEERRDLAEEGLAASIAAMLELGPLWNWERERVLSLAREVDGLEALDAAISSGRGVLLIGPHLGAWEMAGLFVSARTRVTSLYRPPQVRGLELCLKRARERFGARLVPADAGGVRALYRALQRGELVCVLPDQDPGASGGGVFVPFFGQPARTSTLAARLLASTQAVPIMAWAQRLERGRGYRLQFYELEADSLRSGDLELATAALNLELEQLVRRLPGQYLWSYRRFRHRPPGFPNPYRRGGAPAEMVEALSDGRTSGAAS